MRAESKSTCVTLGIPEVVRAEKLAACPPGPCNRKRLSELRERHPQSPVGILRGAAHK